jgi:hypothetical protein
MGQFVDYRNNKNEYKEGKDLITERINAVLSDDAPMEDKKKRVVELKLLIKANDVRMAEATSKFFAIPLVVGGIFCTELLLVSAGCFALAFLLHLKLESLKVQIRRLM